MNARRPSDLKSLWDAETISAAIERMLPRVRGGKARMPLGASTDAQAYAEEFIRATDGEAALAQQAPYIVDDEAETWLVRGTRSRMPGVLDPVKIRLRNADATVLFYGMGFMGGMLAPPPKSE